MLESRKGRTLAQRHKQKADNPTPKSEQEIIESIKEEIMDIQLCVDMVDSKLIDYEIYNRKLNRWYRRLKESGKNEGV